MQYTIEASTMQPDLEALQRAIDDVDPAAMVDIDPVAGSVRISTVIGDAELLGLLNRAGYPLRADELQLVPSQCCGGCSG